MNLKYIQKCRICDNPFLKQVLNLGGHWLHGNFYNPNKELAPPKRKIPVELMQCDTSKQSYACGLTQLSITTPPEILYYDYGYRSSRSQTMKNWLQSIVNKIMEINPNIETTIDVGMNDGFMLNCYPKHVKKTGVDGGSIPTEEQRLGIEVINDFYPCNGLRGRYFDCFTAIACLYDIDDINTFIANVKQNIDVGGLFVFEVAYLPTIIRNVDYSHFVHEHLETYHLGALDYLLEKHGLKIFRAEITPTNGGSILCFACHDHNYSEFKTDENELNLKKIKFDEFEMGIADGVPFKGNRFQFAVDKHANELNSMVKEIISSGKTIHLYSASTKGNVVLQTAHLDSSLIPYAAERSPEKWGCSTVGTNILIISEEESRAMNPDYYLCLIPHFKDEIREREKEFFRRGGKMIFPFPAPISIVG